MASRMTLRVGRVGPDGKAEFGPERVVKVKPDPTVPREDAYRYPPCECPQHRPDLHQERTALRGLRAAEWWAWARH
ncbi:hypothetical protein [Streptomyces iconiensis]|uniref:Uncharacterized protein n=1 Tax=Streptomyces iconiensis TaxID=1384038 RepID=A0ABT6ZNT9_9ACTN|nr:hypothetical protein [Streptomyces iconiensis]MDJ1130716.1 hypothetical protein [Streptomyces iconiensis]